MYHFLWMEEQPAMQHCTVCGSELPDDARFCGKCGHVLSNIDTIDKEPTKILDETINTTNTISTHNTPAENGQDDLTTIDTQMLPQDDSNGHKPVDSPAPVALPPTPQPPQAPAPNARRGSAARWIIIALIIILIVAGSAAALVSLLHLPIPGFGSTPAVVTSPSTSTNVTPVNTVCPSGSTSSICTSTTTTTAGPTPTVKGTATSITSVVNMT